MIDCQTLQEQISVLAIQSPDVPLPDDLRQHLEGCEVCRKMLHQTREAWLLLPASLEQGPRNEAMETALLERINADAASTARRSPVAAIGRYALAASVVIAMLAGTFIARKVLDQRSDINDQEIARINEFARQMDKLDDLQEVFAAPKLHFVSLKSVNSSKRIQGYLVYDLVANEGHFFGFDLRKSSQQAFKLWLLDESGDVISSAIVDVNKEHLGAAVVPLPVDLSTLHEVAITAEWPADAVRPSSEVHMRTRITH